MMRVMILATAGVMLSAPLAVTAQRPISVGIAGGISLPQGDLGDGVDPGWHALATVGLGSLMQPIGLRLDAAYNRFAFDDEALAAADEEGSQTIGSLTLNASYRLPMTNSPLSPYVITGLGAYRSECSLDVGCDASTRFGWNAGLGTKLNVLGFGTFIEGRFHRTTRGGASLAWFPVTLGIMF
jgi:hypothetical protein